MIEYTHSAKEWFVFYHCQTPTQSGLNIKKTPSASVQTKGMRVCCVLLCSYKH